ncbi:hypothetical protein CYMTET_27880 [Cymbomonas tetramitiformis]|uniref:Cyclic nucleotide-binding domain-containing protein n=1 Tax=Cymbomonas tetramitiformis TaxID=36881 RepID=A0AAE0FPH7_9CHLO|nr:hypothetical protein CYMTET_27880 [Cymbomonas tetramitiformis]
MMSALRLEETDTLLVHFWDITGKVEPITSMLPGGLAGETHFFSLQNAVLPSLPPIQGYCCWARASVGLRAAGTAVLTDPGAFKPTPFVGSEASRCVMCSEHKLQAGQRACRHSRLVAGSVVGSRPGSADRWSAEIAAMSHTVTMLTMTGEQVQLLFRDDPGLALKVLRFLSRTVVVKLLEWTSFLRSPTVELPQHRQQSANNKLYTNLRNVQTKHRHGLGKFFSDADINVLSRYMHTENWSQHELVSGRGQLADSIMVMLDGKLIARNGSPKAEKRVAPKAERGCALSIHEGSTEPASLCRRDAGEIFGEEGFLEGTMAVVEPLTSSAIVPSATSASSHYQLWELNRQRPNIALKVFSRIAQIMVHRHMVIDRSTREAPVSAPLSEESQGSMEETGDDILEEMSPLIRGLVSGVAESGSADDRERKGKDGSRRTVTCNPSARLQSTVLRASLVASGSKGDLSSMALSSTMASVDAESNSSRPVSGSSILSERSGSARPRALTATVDENNPIPPSKSSDFWQSLDVNRVKNNVYKRDRIEADFGDSMETIFKVTDIWETDEDSLLPKLAQAQKFSGWWRGFDIHELQLLASEAVILTVPHETSINVRGEKATFLALLLEGGANIMYDMGEGAQQVVGVVNLGDLIGELSMLVSGGRKANVLAEGETAVACFPFKSVVTINRMSPATGFKLLRLVIRSGICKFQDWLLMQKNSEEDILTATPVDPTTFMGMLTAAHAGAPKNSGGLAEGVDQDDIAILAEFMRYVEFSRGAPVLRSGAQGTCMLFVLGGKLDILLGGQNGKLVASKDRGEWVGELAFLMSKGPFGDSNFQGKEAGIRVEEVSVAKGFTAACAVLTQDSLSQLCLQHPQLAQKVYRRIIMLIHATMNSQVNSLESKLLDRTRDGSKPSTPSEGKKHQSLALDKHSIRCVTVDTVPVIMLNLIKHYQYTTFDLEQSWDWGILSRAEITDGQWSHLYNSVKSAMVRVDNCFKGLGDGMEDMEPPDQGLYLGEALQQLEETRLERKPRQVLCDEAELVALEYKASHIEKVSKFAISSLKRVYRERNLAKSSEALMEKQLGDHGELLKAATSAADGYLERIEDLEARLQNFGCPPLAITPQKLPGREEVEPCTEKLPGREKVEPCTEKLPGREEVEPCTEKEVEPCTEKLPGREKVEPCTEKLPGREEVEPCTEKLPGREEVEPCTEKLPGREEVEPCTEKLPGGWMGGCQEEESAHLDLTDEVRSQEGLLQQEKGKSAELGAQLEKVQGELQSTKMQMFDLEAQLEESQHQEQEVEQRLQRASRMSSKSQEAQALPKTPSGQMIAPLEEGREYSDEFSFATGQEPSTDDVADTADAESDAHVEALRVKLEAERKVKEVGDAAAAELRSLHEALEIEKKSRSQSMLVVSQKENQLQTKTTEMDRLTQENIALREHVAELEQRFSDAEFDHEIAMKKMELALQDGDIVLPDSADTASQTMDESNLVVSYSESDVTRFKNLGTEGSFLSDVSSDVDPLPRSPWKPSLAIVDSPLPEEPSPSPFEAPEPLEQRNLQAEHAMSRLGMKLVPSKPGTPASQLDSPRASQRSSESARAPPLSLKSPTQHLLAPLPLPDRHKPRKPGGKRHRRRASSAPPTGHDNLMSLVPDPELEMMMAQVKTLKSTRDQLKAELAEYHAQHLHVHDIVFRMKRQARTLRNSLMCAIPALPSLSSSLRGLWRASMHQAPSPSPSNAIWQ